MKAPTTTTRHLFQTALCAALALACAGWTNAAEVAVIEVRREINKGLERYINRALTDAENKADIILFDMNTPGGRVDVMGDIINHIYNLDIPSIAFVHVEAISAGAVIALAADQIAMAPGGTIGDAAPVSSSGEELGEKIVSFIRGKIRATAERNGRNPDIAEAMVDKKKILARIDNNSVEALMPSELRELKDEGRAVEIICHEGELLTLTTEDALRLGFIELEAESFQEILNAYTIGYVNGSPRIIANEQIPSLESELTDPQPLENADIAVIKPNLAEKLAIGITGSMLGTLLLSLGMVGLLFEFRTPGFGVPGILGLLCVAAFFGGHIVADVTTGFGLLMFLAGLILLAVEAFVIPGFGVAGITGLALTFGGLFFTFARSSPTLGDAVGAIGLSFALTAALVVAIGFTLPKTQAWNRLILTAEQASEQGYQAPRAELSDLIGRSGIALTTLRPAGAAEIDGKRVNVVTNSEYIAKGEPIAVEMVEGVRVVVRAAPPTANPTAPPTASAAEDSDA